MSLSVQINEVMPQNNIAFKGNKKQVIKEAYKVIDDASSKAELLSNPPTAYETIERMRKRLVTTIMNFLRKNIFSYKKEVTVTEFPEHATGTLNEMASKKPLKVNRTFEIHLGRQ